MEVPDDAQSCVGGVAEVFIGAATGEAPDYKIKDRVKLLKLARELGVNLVQVKPSGPKSRVLHEDVKAFVKAILTGATAAPGGGLPKVPSIDFAKFGEIDPQPLTRIQKIFGPRLQASWIAARVVRTKRQGSRCDRVRCQRVRV